MTEGITGIPGTLAHRGTKLFGEHNAMAQEKQEQNRQFSLLFTVAKVVASVNTGFVFKVDREGGIRIRTLSFTCFCTEISKRTHADEKTQLP